jgi:hypothetical protein
VPVPVAPPTALAAALVADEIPPVTIPAIMLAVSGSAWGKGIG